MNQKYKSSLSYELNELLKSSERMVEVTKGTYLFQEGEPAKELYIILNGKIQISKMNAEGRELSYVYANPMTLLENLPSLRKTLYIYLMLK